VEGTITPRSNLPLNLKNELIERLREDAEFGTFSNGFDDGAGFTEKCSPSVAPKTKGPALFSLSL